MDKSLKNWLPSREVKESIKFYFILQEQGIMGSGPWERNLQQEWPFRPGEL